jgi:hypothetical protein
VNEANIRNDDRYVGPGHPAAASSRRHQAPAAVPTVGVKCDHLPRCRPPQVPAADALATMDLSSLSAGGVMTDNAAATEAAAGAGQAAGSSEAGPQAAGALKQASEGDG